MGDDLVGHSVSSSKASEALKESGSVEAKGGHQSIELVSAGVNVALRCGTGLSARFPFTIACKEMTLIFERWPLSRPTILAELQLLEVVFGVAAVLSVERAPSFEAFDSTDRRPAPPSVGMF